MQIVFEFCGSPEEYVATAAHKKVLPPSKCPACGSPESFEPLGYYTRGLSKRGSPGVMSIPIRRFRCIKCPISVSLLPNFAQPYRLVRNETIQKFFDGDHHSNDVRRWDYLLRRYKRRFCNWFPKLLLRVATCLGRPPPMNAADGFWTMFKKWWGPLAIATERLVSGFWVTAFGVYRCHEVPSN